MAQLARALVLEADRGHGPRWQTGVPQNRRLRCLRRHAPSTRRYSPFAQPSVSRYCGIVDRPRWLVSLHGGHSGEFCEHATGTLRESLTAALAVGFRSYGVTEHAPRLGGRFLYASELEKGYTVERLQREFNAYARESKQLQQEFGGRLPVLRGFETEVVPSSTYASAMRELRDGHGFDYVVGSVHHVAEIPIDETAENYLAAVDACGGVESLLERYYGLVQEMIHEVRPEIVAHLDLPKLHAPAGAALSSTRIRRAAEAVIETAKSYNCILDVNSAALRKGLPEPYPSPWLVRLAVEAGVPFCLGDDSHGPQQVGYGLTRARNYLLAHGVDTITTLEPAEHGLQRRQISLRPEPEIPS